MQTSMKIKIDTKFIFQKGVKHTETFTVQVTFFVMSVAMETKPSSSRKRKHNSSSEVAVSVTMENRLSSSRKKKQTAISEKVSIRKYTLRNKSLKDVTSGQSGLSSAPKLNRYGKHEMQISEGGEADLHEHLKGCKKNPDHKTFIPITQFAMNHLPDGLKDNDLLELIKVAAELTVRVRVKEISAKRPMFWPNTNCLYPFYDGKERGKSRFGSGRMMNVIKFTKGKGRNVHGTRHSLFDNKYEQPYQTCQCEDCKVSDNPSDVWWEIHVNTATHVVFDDTEADHTSCRLFYDDDSSPPVEVTNLRVDKSDVETDFCVLKFVTCDEAVGKKLHEKAVQCHELWKKVWNKYKKSHNDKSLFIVSHPHGCSKQVSVGELVDNEICGEVDKLIDKTKLTYTTPTCPGSSGAWVFCLKFGTDLVHSGTFDPEVSSDSGVNYSSIGRIHK